MAEIEFWLMSAPTATELWNCAMAEFKAKTGIRVRLRVIPWETAWTELIKVAIYKHGPDVSEIGNTWLSSLVGMNALHQFSQAEIDSTGGSASFIQPSWQSCSVIGENRIWAVPYIADLRVLYYRRDLLMKAEINEETAFKTYADLVCTLEKLQKLGVPAPWTVPTQRTDMTLHNAASWVWGAGGDLASQDGEIAIVPGTRCIKRLERVFWLKKISGIRHKSHERDPIGCPVLEWEGSGNHHRSLAATRKAAPPDVVRNSGITLPPGIPYVGGSNLVAWQHTRHFKESLALIRFLTGLKMQSEYLPAMALLPVNQEALKAPAVAGDWIDQKMSQSLLVGRSFRLVPMWGLIEDRLGNILSQIWNEIYENPQYNIAKVVEDYMSVLANQLEPALKGR